MNKLLLGLALIGAIMFGGYYENNYTRHECKVIEASGEGCIIEDRCGFTWYWEENGFNVGDTVEMKLNTNGTASYIEDDIIKSVIKK